MFTVCNPATLMDPEEVLIRDLQAWACAKYGRRALLARKLGVSKQLVSFWITRKRTPTLHHGFAIQSFLKGEALRDKDES
jgi:DNA-binding transcriptional regulator YdaS (Cro superfamily)